MFVQRLPEKVMYAIGYHMTEWCKSVNHNFTLHPMRYPVDVI